MQKEGTIVADTTHGIRPDVVIPIALVMIAGKKQFGITENAVVIPLEGKETLDPEILDELGPDSLITIGVGGERELTRLINCTNGSLSLATAESLGLADNPELCTVMPALREINSGTRSTTPSIVDVVGYYCSLYPNNPRKVIKKTIALLKEVVLAWKRAVSEFVAKSTIITVEEGGKKVKFTTIKTNTDPRLMVACAHRYGGEKGVFAQLFTDGRKRVFTNLREGKATLETISEKTGGTVKQFTDDFAGRTVEGWFLEVGTETEVSTESFIGIVKNSIKDTAFAKTVA